MWELTKIVIPKIKAHWSDLAKAMRYKYEDIKAFENEDRDLKERCEKLLTNWLNTGHGPEPKTYQTLLDHIKEVDELTRASKEIEEELIKGKDK